MVFAAGSKGHVIYLVHSAEGSVKEVTPGSRWWLYVRLRLKCLNVLRGLSGEGRPGDDGDVMRPRINPWRLLLALLAAANPVIYVAGKIALVNGRSSWREKKRHTWSGVGCWSRSERWEWALICCWSLSTVSYVIADVQSTKKLCITRPPPTGPGAELRPLTL